MILRSTVFISGAALMALEILGTRVLAPAMGNSIFVWGSLISSFMLAMSAGYWLGGMIADTSSGHRTLGAFVAIAGLLVALTPLIAPPTLRWAVTLGPRMGPLVSSCVIFFLPALALAMTSPVGVRMAVGHGGDGVGRAAGGLYAVSTIGSIAGTLATAFWLIPSFRVEVLVFGTGAVLLGTGVLVASIGTARRSIYSASRQRRAIRPGVIVVAAVVLAAAGYLYSERSPKMASRPSDGVVFQKDTQYHRITVVDQGDARFLKFDNSFQTGINKKDGYTSVFPYSDYFDLSFAIKPDIERALVIGLGGGAAPKRMWRDFPSLTTDVAEIDPVVVDVARKYFDLPEDRRITVAVEDGRRYVARTPNLYDLVIMDAYYADSIPFHLTTAECFREIKAKLRPGGVVAYNIIGAVSGESSRLFRSMYRTISEVWRAVYVFPIGIGARRDPGALRNILVFATDVTMPRQLLLERIATRAGGRVAQEGFPGFAQDLYEAPIATGDVPTLTDSFAPTDTLLPVK